MLFPDDLPTAKAWMEMQRAHRDYARRGEMDRKGLKALAEALYAVPDGLAAKAARAHGGGYSVGLYTRLSFEIGSAELALKKTRETAGELGLPFDKDISRSKVFGPAAHLWAAYTHFMADELVPCSRKHLADWLSAARAYQLELELAGRELMRIPDGLRLPTRLLQPVGTPPLDRRMRQPKALVI